MQIGEIVVYEIPIRPTIKNEETAEKILVGKGVELPPVPAGEMVGLEVEVEKVFDHIMPPYNSLWVQDVDGSLKVAGAEFRSIPIRSQTSMVALAILKEWLEIYSKGYECSHRAAFHVHVNVRDLTPQQLAVMCLLYSTLEKVFFHMTEEYRVYSNFCVPVNHTETFYSAVKDLLENKNITYDDLTNFVEDFGGKYAAFGVFRLCDLGTVEFRHMHSNFDFPLLAKWITMAVNLKHAAKRLPVTTVHKLLKNINTTSHYDEYVKSILGVDNLLPDRDRDVFFRSISESIANAKQVFVKDIKDISIIKLLDSPLGKKIAERIKL